jgi:hypothetical protein
MAAIFLRAGWTLGNVPSRYIFSGGGGDNLCGRICSLLNMNNLSFADLPPSFTTDPLPIEEWENIMPGYSTYFPDKFRPIFPFLLASLLHHKQWLLAN